MSYHNKKTNKLSGCQLGILIILIIFFLINICILFFILVFTSDVFLYTYDDIGGDFYPYIINLDVLFFGLFFSVLGFIIEISSIFIAFVGYRLSNLNKKIKLVFIIFLTISIIGMIFYTKMFFEFKHIDSLVEIEGCELQTVNSGCFWQREF